MWSGNWDFGLIDNMGREIVPIQYRYTFSAIRWMTDELLMVHDSGYWGVKDTSGHWVLPPVYYDIRGVGNDLWAINIGGIDVPLDGWGYEIIYGLWGFIDAAGRVIIPPVLEFDSMFLLIGILATILKHGCLYRSWLMVHINIMQRALRCAEEQDTPQMGLWLRILILMAKRTCWCGWGGLATKGWHCMPHS